MGAELDGQPEAEALQLRDRLQEQHRNYSQQLKSLASEPYLSEEAKVEEVRLKKLKLRIKDQLSRLPGAAHSTSNGGGEIL